MPIINEATFEQRKKALNLTNKAIAEAARVTETTVGKIKNHKNLQNRSVQEIAKALKLTTEQLTSPPEPIADKGWYSEYGSDYRSAASILYNVPEHWIADHAGLFFILLAEQSLQQRSEKAQQCLTDFKSLNNKLFLRDENFNPDLASDDYLDAIYRELDAIEQKDLSGPRDKTRNQNSHFINFLCELEDTWAAEFEMYDAQDWDTNTQTYVERGAEIENLSYYLGVSFDATWKLLPDEQDNSQHQARNIIIDNNILHKIPPRLRTPERADDLVKWVFRWYNNTINELLPEHPEKSKNDHRMVAKSILKETYSIPTLTSYYLKNSQPDNIAEYVIENHENRVAEAPTEDENCGENSDA